MYRKTEDYSKLEQYLLSENKEEFLKSLVSGSQEAEYFTLLNSFATKEKLSSQDTTLLDKYNKTWGVQRNGNYTSPLELRKQLMAFNENKGNQKKQQEIINFLNENFFHDLTFNHNKPSNIGQTAVSNQQNNQNIQSKLDESLIEFSKYAKNSIENPHNLSRISSNALSRLDFSKINTKQNTVLGQIEDILRRGDLCNWGDKAIELCEKYADAYKSHHKQEYFPDHVFQRLTLHQLEKLGSKVGFLQKHIEYCSQLFQKNFEKDLKKYTSKKLQDLSIEEKKQLRQLLLKIIEWSKSKLHKSMYSLADQLFYIILVIDLEMETCDKKLFIQFLENPLNYSNSYLNFNENYQKQINKLEKYMDGNWQRYHNLDIHITPDHELVEQYLNFFFLTADKYDEFSKYFETSYLKTLFYRVKLQQGQTFSNINDILGSYELEELTKSKEITICNSNNKFFKAGEDISLSVDIKNIQNLNVKVFEINTENYYIKNKSNFDNSIALEGINPLDQQASKQFKENPIIKKRHEFKFQKLSTIERGVFVIEFIGNGISSRAVVRKGGLSLLEKQTLAGHQLTLITEDQKVCTPTAQDHTGIWINNRFIKANKEGIVFVPYGENIQQYPIILVHNDYAELSELQVKTEEYQFKAAYLYHDETFLRGNKAKVIVQGRLYINGIDCNMKLIEEPQITAVLVNEQDIPNTYTFKNLKLTHNNDIEIEIPVQNMIGYISITFSGKIKKLNGSYQNLHSSHHIEFNLYENSDQFSNIYLSQNEKGYIIQALGKNGEPKKDMIIDLSLSHKYITEQFKQQLKTNEKGQIELGMLSEIQTISANMRASLDIQSVSRHWNISKQDKIQYPQVANLIEGDVLTFPSLSSEVNKNLFSLYEISSFSGTIIADHSQSILYNNNRIILKGLKAGSYKMAIKDVNHIITINVIKGNYWSKNGFQFIVDENDNSFTESTPVIDQNLAILDCKLVEKDVNIQVLLPENVEMGSEKARDMIRLHVFAYNINSNQADELSSNLRTIKENASLQKSQFGMKKSVFLNNKQLGDEICYVFERKNQKKYIGNTLEKPNILLKRTFVRDTEFDKENLEQDKGFKEGMQDQFIQEKGMVHRMACEQQSRCVIPPNTGKDSMINFLQYPALTFSNLKVNADGLCVIKDFPAERFSCIQVVATNLAASVSDHFTLERQQALPVRDIRLKSNLVTNKPFTEKRGSVILKKGMKEVIKSDTESVIIDNISQFFEIQKELRITAQGTDRENEVGYRFWDFLQNWNSLTEDEKLKKYDEFACHEINIFLYMKDRVFFEKVVFPFLQNKIEKSFVDYFLLNAKEEILTFSQPQNVQKLNYMERCLLVSHLMSNQNEELAQKICSQIQLQQKTQVVQTNVRKNLFDTVISAKSKSPATAKISQVQGLYDERELKGRGASIQQRQQTQACYSMAMDMDMAPSAPLGANMLMKKSKKCKESFAPQRAMMMMEEECLMDRCEGEAFGAFDQLMEQRQQYKPGYQKLKKTKEYIERTYFNLKSPSQQSTYIRLNQFWASFAQHIVDNKGSLSDFLNENFIFAMANHAEMICCLAFTALEFQGGQFDMSPTQGRGIQIECGNGNLIIFMKDIILGLEDIRGEISITQRLFDPKDRFAYLEDEPDVKVEKAVDELIVDKIYGCQTIITNCTISALEFQILTEIPEGSIPIHSVDYTKSHTLRIESYQTQKIEFFFYFPAPGTFQLYPANVSRNEKVLSYANNMGPITVKTEKTIKKLESFTDIIRNGSQEDILKFISEKNILNPQIFRFSDIYWLLKDDSSFFEKFVSVLKQRNIFDYTTWTYALLHKNPEIFVELFQSNEFQQRYFNKNNQRTDIRFFQSELLKINTVQLFEYHPLLSSRTHNFMNEQKSKILNIQFKETYVTFLNYLAEVKDPLPQDYITWAYYLLLQERIEESIKIFQKIDKKSLNQTAQIQYDYMSAYMDIYTGQESNFQISREVSTKYLNYPVLSWRNLFMDLHNQLQEYDGENVDSQDQVKESELNKNLKTADTEESLTFEVDKTDLVINHQNIDEITICFYEIDLEVLFSRTPFLNKERDEFSFVKANHTEILKKQKSNLLETTRLAIPKDLANLNLYILLKSPNQVLSTTYFSNNLKVQVIENYGQVKVMDQKNKPLSKVYVKTFAKDKSGTESFYRDGYTDLRGRFDYALSSSSDINTIEKFSILICSEEFGSIIKEANTPSQLGSMQKTISLLKK